MNTSTKKRLYHEFASIAKALASPDRLEILDLLAQGEKTVEVVANATELTIKNTSAHLRVLRTARLVDTRRHGTFVWYRLADDAVIGVVRQLQALARDRVAEVERAVRDYLGDRAALEPVSARELRERIREGHATVLDVRPRDEYDAGHLPGAVSIPLSELKKRLRELPNKREVIAYCRGPYCVYAVQAVNVLQRAGYRARRSEIGVPDWKLLGHKVEV